MTETIARPNPAKDAVVPGSGYSWYALGICVAVYFCNFLDRQIIAILAEDIKRDLQISDAELGVLYGAAFAIFYSLFGIPIGRLADGWIRTRLMGLGLLLWSSMTMLSGFATSFVQLALARVGVGVGEASGAPCAFSLLTDYFPPRQRATVLAIYSSGLYLGGGCALLAGGLVVQHWNQLWPDASLAPLGLRGWQAAFIAAGLPGLLLAMLVFGLREPVRGLAEGKPQPPRRDGWRKAGAEMACLLPPFTFVRLFQLGGAALLRRNLMIAMAIMAGALLLIRLTGSNIGAVVQWSVIGTGLYAVTSWAQGLRHRDPPAHALMFGTPAFLYGCIGFGLISVGGYTVSFWTAPFVERVLGQDKASVGLHIGGGSMMAGFLGVILGGLLADRLRSGGVGRRIWVAACSPLLSFPIALILFNSRSPTLVYALNIPLGIVASMWVGVGAATVQDLLLPRMRGTGSAFYILCTTLIGLAMGPYVAGLVSSKTGSLPTGILSVYAVLPLTCFCLWRLYKLLPEAEATREARARAAGEIH